MRHQRRVLVEAVPVAEILRAERQRHTFDEFGDPLFTYYEGCDSRATKHALLESGKGFQYNKLVGRTMGHELYLYAATWQ